MRVRIEKIVYPGKSLARTESGILFTDDGLPGELVEVEPIKEKKNYIQARTLGIVERSSRRTEARCDHFRACSAWQNMDYALQIEIKRDQVREIFGREVGIEPEGLEVIPSPRIWGYRNRARFHVLWQDGEARAAYHKPGEEDEFIRADRCYLVSEKMSALLDALLREIGAGDFRSLADIEIRQSAAEDRLLAVLGFKSDDEIIGMKPALGRLREAFPSAGVVGLIKGKKDIREIALLGKNHLQEEIGGLRFRIGARSFFQVNTDQLSAVADEMRHVALAEGEARIADLYCGIGTFGLLLAREAKEVFGVESDPGNIEDLKKNLSQNGIGNFTLCEGASEEWIGEILRRNVDILILDPPRRGIEPNLGSQLIEKSIRTIIYLSCNPATLARDIKRLLRSYRLGRVKVYDFFPHTPHIETLAVLHRI